MDPTSDPNPGPLTSQVLGDFTPKFVLSLEQKEAIDRIIGWHSTGVAKTYRLGGFAGTGKTTMIKHIISSGQFGSVACCAFTGKAADVLTKKGVRATTIHSLIYEVDVNLITKEVIFTLKTPGQLDLDLIIVDESSMVSSDLYRDLLSFHIPILFVGDPGQLEPVGDNPNLMRDPDFVLETIHRQALESPIIYLAHEIRTKDIDPRRVTGGARPPELQFTTKNLTRAQLESADQIICAKNVTRQLVNSQLRRNQGYRLFDGMHKGEKLICLRNNRSLGFFNGQVMYVEEIKEERPTYFEALVRADGTSFKNTVKIWSLPFYRDIKEQVDKPPKDTLYCDFGYCITCHKAQGSEWPHVLVIDEWMPPKIWDMKRWRYTAVTRAAKQLTYAM